MVPDKLRLPLAIASITAIAGCATLPEPNPAAKTTYCLKSNKGRVITCTRALAPSLNADADAKQFAPDPGALTVYVVRRNWSDSRNFVMVQADDGPAIETLPDTMVRLKLKPGVHTVAFEFRGERQSTRVNGKAGEMRFLRIDGTVWSWASTYAWANEPENAIRERALKARLVADVAIR